MATDEERMCDFLVWATKQASLHEILWGHPFVFASSERGWACTTCGRALVDNEPEAARTTAAKPGRAYAED